MKDFTFDLQRFAAVCSLNGTSYDSFAAAYAVANDGDTITLLQDASSNGFEIAKNITFDLGGYTYTLTYRNDNSQTRAFTSSTGANYTFKNGTIISLGSAGCINNSGTLTLEDINIASTTRAYVTTKGNTATNYIKGKSSVIARAGRDNSDSSNISSRYILDNGVVITTATNATSSSTAPTITTQSDNSAVVTLPSVNRNFTATEPGSKEVTYTANTKVTGSASSTPALSVAYDSSGNPSIQNLGAGLVFTVATNSSSGSSSVQYTVTAGGLYAVSGGITKVLQNVSVNPNTPIAMTYLDFDSSANMVPAIFATNGVLSVSSSDLTLLNAGDELLIVDDSDYTKSYGTLRKVDDNTFALTKDGTDTLTLSRIVINDALTAQISAAFRNIPITAYVSNRIATSLTSSSNNPFTLSSDKSAVVSLQGDISVSLTGGSIKTANSDVTIRTGNNTVYYTANTGDGVNVIAASGNGTISGIDVGESFNVGTTSYWRDNEGLRTGITGVFTSDVASVSANDNSIAIDLASLRGAVGSFVQPENGVLEIGKTHTGNAVVVDSTSNPQIKYAELLVDSSNAAGNTYTLTPASDGNVESFLGATDTISITGGTNTTIYKNLVNGSVRGVNKALTIATGTASTPDATFKVTEVNGNTFVVNLRSSSSATYLTNATGITLLSGTIRATRGQTITLGDNGRKFYVTRSSAGMNVTFDNGTATITANANDRFTVSDGNNPAKEFTVDANSDGMTFTVTADNITANGLGTADGDAFTYGGANYSVRGAGFIRTVGENQSLWSDIDSDGEYTGNHSLQGGSVIIESLPANDNHVWDAIATVRASDNSATLPPSDTSTKVTLIGNDLKQTYGVFTKSGTGCTLTTGSGTNEAKLSRISVTSGVDNFEFGAGLDSITINSAVASLMVTEDEGDNGYKVTLIGSSTDNRPPAILEGISRVSLISGSLRSDSAFTTNVLNKGIVAVDQSVTLHTDGNTPSLTSINGLEVGHKFSVEGGDDFDMSEVGLVNKDGRYLLGTRAGNPVIFSELDGDTPWGGLIAAENLTITSNTTTALVVDNTSSPSALYADYININGGQTLRAANSADAWDSDITIYVSDTTVNFTSYFEDKKIQGVSSRAAFTVEDGVNFSVQDLRTGAVIGSATNVSQTAGTISLQSGQVIHSRAGSISAGTGDLTFTVNDTAGTIGALDNSDVFSLETDDSANVEYTRNNVGIVTNDNRILTGLAVRESVTVAQLLGENWTNTVQINSEGVLALPPTVSSDLASPWIILSNDKDSAYGTLELIDGNYSIHRSNNAIASLESDWASSNTISLLSAQTVTLTKDYSGAWISGLRSGASVSTSDATDDFTVTDSAGGATVSGSGAVKVNQAAGLLVPTVGQTVTAADNYAIAATSKDGDIKISVSGSDAIVTNLSEGDTFTINDHSFEVLTGGVIRRDGSELRQGSASESAADLIDNWLGRLEIDATSNWVMDGDYLRNNMTADRCYIVDKANNERVYGTIERATSGSVTTYTVSVDGANVTPFASVTINTNIERVTFAKEHYITNAIPITAGNATFTVTDLNVDNFTVNYDGTAGVETATAVNLSSGTLKLTDPAQVVTMGSTTAAVNGGTVTVNYDGTTVTVGSMDAGDSVKINGTYDYTYNSGNGMTIEVASGVTTFKNLDDDSFTAPDGAIYTVNANGFVKEVNGTNYMWTGSTDVSNGVTLSDLNTTSNWTQIAVVADGDLTVDSSSTATVVLVGNTDNPAETIYGTLNVSGSERTLTADGGKNAELNSITINGVTVSIASDFSKVPIIPKGSNPTINISTAMTFKPEDDGQVFKVVMNGEETEYTYSVSESNYRLSRGSEGNILTLTQNNNTYTLPGGRWVTSGGYFTIPNGESVILEYGTTTTTVSCNGGDYITARGAQGQWQEFGALTAGDKFTVENSGTSTSYKVLSDGKTLGKYDATDGTINTVLSEAISDNATLTNDAITSGTYKPVMTLTSDGVLNLTAQPAATFSSVQAYAADSEGDPDPTNLVITNVGYDGTKYTLNTQGSAIDELKSVSLGAVTELSTVIDTTVTTPTTGVFTVNGNPFTARTALQIQSGTSNNSSTLIGGTVSVAQGSNVTTLSNNITNTIAATSGAVTVTVGDNVTIGSLTAGKVFGVDGTPYNVTSIGLTNADVTRLLDISNNAVTAAAIGGNAWQTVYEAPSGALTINADTPAGVTVVDISNPSNAKKYGTIARSGSAYAFTSSGSDKLSSITADGVEAIFDSANSGITVNAGGATFSATASGNFTVDATSTPELRNVEAVSLISGKIQAPTGVTVQVGTRRITATEGEMNVGIESNKVVVSNLNPGDKFNVGNVSYEMMSTGLYNSSSGQRVTAGVTDNNTRFVVDDAAFGNIITLDEDNNLDLTGQPSTTPYTALVVGGNADNVDLTKTIATVDYDGTTFTLTAGGNVSDMASVSLDAVKNLTTSIETAIKAKSTGTYSINGKTFAARDALELETTSTGAILTSGTVTLAQGSSVDTPNNSVSATNGTVYANVNGSTITVSNLAAGKAFSVGDNSHTMTAIGLSDGSRLLESVTNTVDTTALNGNDWQTILQAAGGALSVDSTATTSVVADMSSATNAIKYGTLTRSGAAYTYARNGSNTLKSITLSGVAVTFDKSNAGVSIDTGSAKFSVSASARNFTVNATSTPELSNVTGVTLNEGTIKAPSNIPVQVGNRRITATNGAMNIGINAASKVVISELNNGDTFNIGNESYEMMATGLYNSTSGQFVTAGLNDDMTAFTVDDAAYGNIIPLDENGNLDLRTTLAATSYTAFAVGLDDEGNADVSKKVAKVEYDGTGYTLTADANVSEMASVSLNSVKTLTTAVETTINAETVGTYSINGKPFIAREPLIIETTPDSAILLDGSIVLAEGTDVITPDKTVAATTGSITVEADGSTINLGGLAAGRVFTVDGTEYTMTKVGLRNSAGTQLLDVSNATTTAAALEGSDWQTILPAVGGALSINGNTTSAVVADVTNAANAVKYGNLTRSGSNFTYKQSGSDVLSSITLDGVTATFDKSNAGVPINTGNAAFTVTASKNFTVNATGIPSFTNVSAISLTSGTVQAPSKIPVTVGGNNRRITAANGAMNVGIEGNKVVVSELNTGDKFTVDNVSYEMTAAGLYDADNGRLVKDGVSDDMTKFTVDDAAFENVVAIDENGNLDLRTAPASTTYTALVVGRDAGGNVDVTKSAATLSYDSTAGYTLTAGTNASEMTSVSLSSVRTLNTNTIETTVTTPASGTYSINGKNFTARSELEIETKSGNATLTSGTVSLTAGNSVNTPNNEITAATGNITVEVSGSAVNLGGLNAGRVFTVDGTEYTMTNVGLTNSAGTQLLDVTNATTTVAALGGSDWQNILQATGGALSINGNTTSAVVADMSSATSAVKYGNLTKSGSTYTYQRDGSNNLTSITISGVEAVFDSSNAGIPIDTGNAVFTVTASDSFTADATGTPALSNVESVSLTSGEIQAPANVTVQVGNNHRITATNGAMNVGFNEDGKVVVSNLNIGDTFTVGNVSYEMTAAGLYDAENGQLVKDGVSDDLTQFIVDDAGFENVVALDEDGNLDLRTAPATTTYTALVVGRDSDGNIDVTKKVANLSYDGSSYTLTKEANASEMETVTLSSVRTLNANDIETTVITPANGTYSINGKDFTARAALEIETKSGGATLTGGTVSLSAGNSVDTPSNTVTATAGTVTVAVSGSRVTVGNLAAGRVFSVDGNEYTMTAIGLSDGSRLLSASTAVTAAAINGSDWQNILQATGGALSINENTSAGAVVADMSSATSAVKFGNLAKDGSAFTYTRDGSDLTSITLSGVSATFDSSNAGIPIDTGSAVFTVSAGDNFTVNATSTPAISGVSAVTLTEGKIKAPAGVTVNVSSYRITATGGEMNIGIDDSGKVVVSELNTGDTFDVGNTSYEMTNAGLYNVTNGQIVTAGVSDDLTAFTVDDAAFGNVITLDEDGNLDLTAAHVAGYAAQVVGRDADGNIDLSKRVANVTCDGSSYTLTEGDNVSEMTSVSLGAVSKLTTDIETTVTTPSSGTYTINGDSFAARSELTIETESGGAKLIGGTVALSAGNSVDTPNDTVSATSGTITVNVDGSTVTVGNLTAGKVFSVDDTEYTMTQIGLSYDSRLLNVSGTVTLDEISGSDWQIILTAAGGALVIDRDTTSAAVVDISSPTNAVRYGDLVKSGSTFTYTRDGNNTLGSITISGVSATFDSSNAGVPITAGDATFTVTASGDFTVDATSTPELSNVSAISLTSGTVKAPIDVTISVGTRRITATNGDMNVGLVDNKVVVSALNTGDTFNVGNTSYEMTNAGLYDAVNGQIVTEGVSEDRTTFIVDDAAFGNVINLDENGYLDLTGTPVAGYAALVVGLDADGNIDISKAIATVEYDGTGYTLTQAGSHINELNGVLLSTVKTLDTSVATSVLTNAVGSYTVNDKIFDAITPLEITATATSALLQDGTVNLAAGVDLNTPNNTVASNAGTVQVTVDGSEVTIGNLSAGKAFSVDDTDYSMTSIGLSDGNRILQTDSDVTLDELASSDWLAILNAPSGALVIDGDTASSIVVDISNPSNAVNYGILTKAGTNYTYIQSGSDVLQSVILDGVAATFPRSCAAATFTAGDSIFSIGTSGDFTVDDTGSVPSLSGATAVTLTAGAIQAPLSVPVTVGSRKITATNGTMQVVSGQASGVSVAGLNAGETFTVGNKAYRVTSAGELFNETDSMIVTSGFDGDTFTTDGATLTRIITADGTNLDLTNQTQSALVYDDDTNPVNRLANLNVTGVSCTLTETDDNIIRTIDIKAGSELTLDFDATISASGNVEVNDVTYNGTGDLIICADDTTSQLYSGTITLTPAVTAPEAANDTATLAVENGSLNATAVNGRYTTLTNLNAGDSFTYNGTTYTQSKFGLLQGGNICESLAGSSITLSALDNASWVEFLAPVANVLDISSASVNAAVYDDYTNPTKKVAELSLVNGRKILKGTNGASKAIQTAVLSDGDNLTVDFQTQVSAGSATVNGTAYNGTSDLLIDARANVSSLYSGSVTIDAGNSLKATNDSGALAVTSGSVVATASQGRFISLNGVDSGDTFTFDGNTYTMTALGLLSGNSIAQELADSFVDLTTLGDAQWLTFLAPRNGTLDISGVSSSKIVFDSVTNPVNKLADLTVDGNAFTLAGTRYASDIQTVNIAKDSTLNIDFAAQVTAPVGVAVVNGKTFNATTAVTLDATADGATLARGTVALGNEQSVTTSSGYTVTANAGDGLTVTASTNALTVGGLNAGDDFSVDERNYSLRDIGLLRDDLIYLNSAGVIRSGSVTVNELLSDDWRQAIFIDGSLNLPLDFNSGFLLDQDLTRLYGYLVRDARNYTLTAPTNVNATLDNITLGEVSLVADSAFAGAGLTAGDSRFSAVALANGANTFTLDATDVPTFTGVASFTLEAGTVAAKAGQLVTAGEHVISGDLTVALDDGVKISDFDADFTLDGDTYHVAPIGLINLTDSAVVTGGLSGNTLRVVDIELTPFIGVSGGTIDLTNANENILIYDSVTDPANQIATLTVDGNKFTLNGSDAASLIQTINVAAGSVLTVDFAARVDAPSGSVTVNGKTYNATTAVTLQSDGTTSTLTAGTVALANGETVNTTGGNVIAATAGDGLTVNAATDSVTVSGLNKGDTFTADGKAYTVGTLNLLHDGKLWTGDAYEGGVTVAALNDDTNWKNMLSATYSSVAVDGATLDDGGKAVLVDNTTDPTTTYGTLSKTDGIYLLMKDDTEDDRLAAISVQGMIIDIDVELADVPITTINADESESVFTVKPSAGVETFRVDATGNSPRIYGVDEIDLIRGKVLPQDGQIVKPADGSETITLSYGNGTYTIGDKTITIGGLNDGENVDIEINGDGNINSVYNIPKDAYVIYDGTTYTAPFDNARLSFEEDPCYFDGYTLPAYSVRIDSDGNIKVDTGIQFGKVIEGGKTLPDDGTIQINGDGSAVKITNESEVPLKVVDTDGDTLAENLKADEGVTFSDDGVSADDLTAVAGATVYLDDGQALTAEGEATVAAQGDATVGVNEDGTGISVDGSAVIDAPADTQLTLGDAPYTVKGADFESSGTAQATVTPDGVKVDLGISDAITHDDMTLTGGESSTVELKGEGGVTLTSGATAENATDKLVTVDGTVQLDDKTVKASEPVEVTEKTDGLRVGDTELTVGGDSTGWQVNIDDGNISGLENVGNGATIGGLSDATIKTNEEGSLTVGEKTFTTTGDSAITYGLSAGSITSISDLDGILAGDFSDGVTVNGDPLTVDSSLKGAVAIAADEDGVNAVQTGDADTYTINGHTYETSGDALFGMSNASVTGVTTGDGIFAIGQDEENFAVNGASLTLSRNTNPVTLGITGGAISAVYGVDGAIGGLGNAAVFDLTKATVNGKPLDVSGTTFDAIVADGTVKSIVGFSAPATVNTAPDVSIVTGTDGTYQIGSQAYTIADTIDGSVTFTTDENSRLTGINNFAGSLNGAVTSLTLNGKDFGTNNGSVTVSSDGYNITAIDGLRSGDSIGGDIDSATFFMPPGNLTINGGVYTLEDDPDGATAQNGGKVFRGVEKDASLTVGADGFHRVNGGGGRASVGSVFTVNRDGGYLINPNFLPIIEKTPASDIRGRSDGTLALQETNGTVGAGNDTVVVRRDAQVTVDASGEPLIIATSGNVTLENYSASSASVGSFEYTNLANAIKTNAIQFGDGVMTLGDAVITFNANAGSVGATQAQLVNAQGREQAIGFTHTNGGTVNASGATAAQVLKGNYAEKSSDTQKSGGSNVVGGSGNDTLLVGAGDTVNGGAGDDHIYITDGAFRELGALLIMSAGSDVVHNFNGGYTASSDTIRITDLSALEYEAAANLVLRSGTRSLTFDGFSASSADLVTGTDLAESADTATMSDGSYRLKLRDGNGDYNAAVARAGRNIYVADGDLANVFFGTNSGVNFSEYTGAVAVNLDTGTGNVGSSAAQFKGINQLTGGAGASTLTGAADVSNTLTAGTGGGQIWSNSGNDLMIGQSGKTSATTFQYLGGDGRDTIKSFEFATSADAAGDFIDITTANAVTTVSLSGGNVILYINGSDTDYLTLAQGKGNDFRINNLVAQVDDRQLAFDGLANCYVADGGNATLQVAASVESAEVWLNDKGNGLHGAYYLGDITVLDGSKSAGQLILTGNDLDNTVMGGAGTNSIWGGYGYDSDLMTGGAGQNTFFFALVNGNDIIQGAHDGDVIDLTTVKTSDIVGTSITDGGTAVGLWDGSVLEVRSNAAVEYKTADGTYVADHASGQWVKKG